LICLILRTADFETSEEDDFLSHNQGWTTDSSGDSPVTKSLPCSSNSYHSSLFDSPTKKMALISGLESPGKAFLMVESAANLARTIPGSNLLETTSPENPENGSPSDKSSSLLSHKDKPCHESHHGTRSPIRK
jgi:hypothetical protein